MNNSRATDKHGIAVPISIRLSDEDHALLKDLEERTGLVRSGVIKLALRALKESLDSTKPKAQKKSRHTA